MPAALPAERRRRLPPLAPWLQGRATVQMDIKFTDARENLATGGRMTIVLDGYNAPVRCFPRLEC